MSDGKLWLSRLSRSKSRYRPGRRGKDGSRVPARPCARTLNADGFFQHLAQDGFNHFLYGDTADLPLPAVILESVVGDMEEVPFDRPQGRAYFEFEGKWQFE